MGVRVVGDDRVEPAFYKHIVVVGLGVDQDGFGKAGLVDLVLVDQFHAQAFDHGHVVGPVDVVDVADGHGLNPSPQQAFDRHGAGDGVRVRVDHDQHAVVAGEHVQKAGQFFLNGQFHAVHPREIFNFFLAILAGCRHQGRNARAFSVEK